MKNQIFLKKFSLLVLLFICLMASLLCLGAAKAPKKKYALAKYIKPYVGEYTCESLQLGEENLLKDYLKISISLQPKGKGLLLIVPKKGGRQSEKFQYSYDYASKQLTFLLNTLDRQSVTTTPLKDGQFELYTNILQKPLLAKFSM